MTALNEIASATKDHGGDALKMRISEQYIDIVQDILAKSNVLMVPEGADSDGLGSPRNIAQIMATYNHMSGSGKSSALADSLLSGNDTALLQ